MPFCSDVNVLVQAVLQRPDDVRLRHVLADALLEAGDARGEYMALQFHREQTGDRPSARERELLDLHREQWLGRLKGLVCAPRFERGFVYKVQLLNETEIPSGAERFDEWATVASVDARSLSLALEVRLFGSSSFRGLKEVNGVSLEAVNAVTRANGPLPWRHLGVTGFARQFNRMAVPSLISLRLFEPISAQSLKELLDSSLGQQLVNVTFALADPRELNEMLGALLASRVRIARGSTVGGEFTVDIESRTIRAGSSLVQNHQINLPGVKVIAR